MAGGGGAKDSRDAHNASLPALGLRGGGGWRMAGELGDMIEDDEGADGG